MPIFQIKKDILKEIREQRVDFEKDIQRITGNNLKGIFGLNFVSSEFTIKNLRIDTLAFDILSKSFVIIEYKKDKNYSVIDQGYSYLAVMLNSKADFLLELNEKTRTNYKRNEIDWSQSRVIFISPEFTYYQKSAINFKDLPIELYEVKLFENNTIGYTQLITESSESIRSLSKKSRELDRVEKEIKSYGVEHHLNNKPKNIVQLFYNLREKILEIDDNIIEKPVKTYIGYRKGSYNFICLFFYHSKIDACLSALKKEFNDPKSWLRDIPKTYQWGEMCRFSITKLENIGYALDLINQAYKIT